MPFNGGGSFSPPGADFPAVANTLIESTKFNNIINDIATGLSTCITKDGQTTVTANIPFGGFRLTGIGAATARTDAARASQVQDGPMQLLGTVAGTNTITAVLTPAIAAYASGQLFVLVPANTNTGSTTLSVNSIGAKDVFSGGAACVGNELIAGIPVLVEYDGTQFNIVGGALTGSFTGSMTGISGSVTASIKYVKRGNQVTIDCPTFQGISNTTAKTITGAPAGIFPAANKTFVFLASDNGGSVVAAQGVIGTDGVLTLNATISGGSWTASGTATINRFTVTYLL